MRTVDESVQAAAEALRGAQRVVAATGAGMSRESGIPTFREAQTGLWAQFDPEALATEHAFRQDPARVFSWYAWRRKLVADAKPHAGYTALVTLESLVSQMTVITQNVDGLHRRAGATDVIELHGALDRFICVDCRHPFLSDCVPMGDGTASLEPPPCEQCGAAIRPAVVWFGEALPEAAQTAAWHVAASCDVMMVIGTSSLVYPAAYLPRIAGDAGATIIEINPEATDLTPAVDIACLGAAGTILPQIIEAAEA